MSAAVAELRTHCRAERLSQADLRDWELLEAAERTQPDALVVALRRVQRRIVDGERKTEGSVEEFILDGFRTVFQVGKPGNWTLGGRV